MSPVILPDGFRAAGAYGIERVTRAGAVRRLDGTPREDRSDAKDGAFVESRFTRSEQPGTLPVLNNVDRPHCSRPAGTSRDRVIRPWMAQRKGLSSMVMLGKRSRLAVALAALALTCVGAAPAGDDGPPKKGVALGLATQRITDTWREKNEYRASGVLVVGVDPAGRAAKGGIATGDVLVSVDGRTLREPSDLGYAERTIHADQPVAIVLARDGGHSIKMFDIAPLTDAGPGVSPAAAAATTTAAPAAPEPAATEPSATAVIPDPAPA